MGDIDGDGKGSGPRARARFRFRCSFRCTWRIGLQFELGSGSDVRVSVRLSFMTFLGRGDVEGDDEG